ncbi:unnamed protein product [Agarophyton chilense]
MGAETHSEPQDANLPSSSHAEEPEMPPTHTYTAPPSPDDIQRNQSLAPSSSRIPFFAWLCIGCIPFLWLFLVLNSPRPLYNIFFTLLSILPAILVGKFVLKVFADEAVSKSFLISQFLLGAFPLSVVVVIVETVWALVFGKILFSSEIVQFNEFLGLDSAIDGKPPSGTGVNRMIREIHSTFASSGDSLGKSPDPDKILEYLREHVPLWKMIVFALFFAFIVAGLTEEVAKWTLARRYRVVNKMAENLEWDRRISCRGILSVACTGALGFATIENYGFVTGLASSPDSKFGLGLVAMALFRGLLAFPVHVGAQFYVAIAAAQSYIFREPIGVMKSLFIAVMFHGLFDAISFLMLLFVGVLGAPSWMNVFAPILQSCLTVLLVVLCRGRYKALLERERMVFLSVNPV